MQQLKSPEPDRDVKIVHLPTARKKKTVHRSFGALLSEVRRDTRVSQQDIAKAFEQYCNKTLLRELGLQIPKELVIKPLSAKQYGRLERDERSPWFGQLLSLYLAMTAGCGIEFSAEEREEYIELAYHKVLGKTHQYKEILTAQDRQWLTEQLIKADGQQVSLEVLNLQDWEIAPRQNGIEKLDTSTFESVPDTRHVIGREGWLDEMCAYLQMTPPKKLIVVQAITGTGKTSTLNLLAAHVAATKTYMLLPIYRLKSADDKTPQDHLDTFLAELLKDLCGPQGETTKLQPLEQRIKQIMKALQAQPRRTILLLDDAHQVLNQDGCLTEGWSQWFTSFVESPHNASLVLTTRQWIAWPGRERSYISETHLTQLPSEIGAELFIRAGFGDVSNTLLQQASDKCGGNPHLIELCAVSLLRPRYSFDWDDEDSINQVQNHTQRIQDFLADEHIFDDTDKADVEVHQMLERVVSTRLTPESKYLLDVLSAATLPLAFPLLKMVNSSVEYALAELQRVSFLDLSVLASKRVQLLPLAREAGWQLLEANRLHDVEVHLIKMYKQWLMVGSFRGDREQGDVVAELMLLLLKQGYLLDAAQLWIRFGWLAVNQGYAVRVARFAQAHMLHGGQAKTEDDVSGLILLQYQLPSFLGKTTDNTMRIADYQKVHNMAIADKVILEPATDIHITHHLMNAELNTKHFQEAEKLLDDCHKRVTHQSVDADVKASLLERWGWLYGTWCEYVEENENLNAAKLLREKAIELYRQCSDLLLTSDARFPLQGALLKKRLARCHNNIAYHLNRLGHFENALGHIDKAIELKEQGYVQVGSMAASYSEKSIALAGLGRFREALLYDVKAHEDIEKYVHAGYKFSQEDRWMYAVNRGRLYLQLGKIAEAEKLLLESVDNIPKRRQWYIMLAQEGLQEIGKWRNTKISSHYQIDWHWVDRFRYLSAYDAYWWLASSGSFTKEENEQWEQLKQAGPNTQTREQLSKLLTQSRQRELANAIEEQREPLLQYPTIDIDEIRTRIIGLIQLDEDIRRDEQNAIVRHLYHETIEEEIWFLRLIEATYEHNDQHFRYYNNFLNPPPTQEEMGYAWDGLRHLLNQGMSKPETRKISERLRTYIYEQCSFSFESSSIHSEHMSFTHQQKTSIDQTGQNVSALTAKRFFDVVLQQSGFEGWQTIIDSNESGARVEQGLRRFFIPDKPISLERVRHYLSHELAGHVARCVAGERSILGLLGIHTRNSLLTEEGLAVYQDRQMAHLLGQSYDDSSDWVGTLATGLANGITVPPQKFLALYRFFEQFLLLRRLLKQQDSDLSIAEYHAKRLASVRCLRTFRGVPNLNNAGICYTKDALYLRGRWMIERAVAQDSTVLDRLSVGVVALEQLPDLRELEITPVTQSLWQLAQNPKLDAFILSFESQTEVPSR